MSALSVGGAILQVGKRKQFQAARASTIAPSQCVYCFRGLGHQIPDFFRLSVWNNPSTPQESPGPVVSN